MKLLDRHIRRAVVLAMLVVLLVLAGLDFLFTLFEEMGDTDERYQMLDALRYVLLTMPRHIYELLPMAALMGALIGLGILASNNELVVMQSSGVRVRRIVWAVMKPALAVMVLGLCLGEFVAPPLELRAEVGKALASGEEVALSRYGHWQRDGRDYMHFNAIEPGGVLHGVSIYSFNEERELVGNTVAARAVYRGAAGPANWELRDVRQTRIAYPGGSGVPSSEVIRHDSLPWRLNLSPDQLQVLIIDSDKMAISDLFRYARRFEEQGLDAGRYFLGFWKKLLQPLATAALVLVAVSFIFGPLREANMGARVFASICFGLLFIILQRLLNTLSLVYQFDPLAAVLLPILLITLAGAWLLRKAV